MKRLTIITPVIRYELLTKISQSIPAGVRWLAIGSERFETPKNCEYYIIPEKCGVIRRNYLIDKVDSGYVYFLDDDTVIHPNLYREIKKYDFDFIHFNQMEKDGRYRLGGRVEPFYADTGSFVVDRKFLGDIRFKKTPCSDGVFAQELYMKAKVSLYINEYLSIYNALR